MVFFLWKVLREYIDFILTINNKYIIQVEAKCVLHLHSTEKVIHKINLYFGCLFLTNLINIRLFKTDASFVC